MLSIRQKYEDYKNIYIFRPVLSINKLRKTEQNENLNILNCYIYKIESRILARKIKL